MLILGIANNELNPILAANHWVLLMFTPCGKALYGTTLNQNDGIPLNLKTEVGEIYKRKFGRELSDDSIYEVSRSQYCPNFPSQSDASVCGISVLSILLASLSENLLKALLTNKPVKNIDALKFPSENTIYLRHLLQEIYITREISVDKLVSSAGMKEAHEASKTFQLRAPKFGSALKSLNTKEQLQCPRE